MRIGIIGAGGIAARHLEQLAQLDARVTAVVDVNLAAAERFAEKSGATVFRSVDEALPFFDAAYVCTPPGSRVAVIRTLASAGKAIFCEKPLAATIADAAAIVEAVEASGIPFMMGFMRRWHPPYQHLKTMIESGGFGRPLQLFRQRIGYLPMAPGNWRIDANQLVGLTIESVSHDIDLLRWLGGEIVAATGELIESRGDLPGYDDTMAATMRFESGATGLLQVSWASLVQQNQLAVLGTDAASVLSGSGLWSSETLDERVGVSGTQSRTILPVAEANDDGYAGENRAFLELLGGKAVAHPGVRDGLRTVELSHQIMESSHSA